jgi:TonB family protein
MRFLIRILIVNFGRSLLLNKKFWLILITSAFFAFADDDEIILDLNDEIIVENENEFNGIMPEQIKFVEAEYDSALFKQGIAGDVILELLISETGSVDSVAVVGSLNPILDSAAATAAKSFIFNPAKMFVENDTIPVAVIIQYAYHFSIDEQFSKEITDRINLSGRVFERGNRKPLADVVINLVFDNTDSENLIVPFDKYLETITNFGEQFLEDGILVTHTDSDGRFRFHSIPAGKFTMKIPHAGYEIYETSETISTTDSLVINPFLAPLSFQNYEIVAYYKGEEKEVARHQLTLAEAKKIPGLSGDAVKVVQALPGVARPIATLGTIIVRGAGSDDNLFLLDGTDLLLLYHFGGLKSTYNSEALETIDFYPGGWGSQFGNATGGVVSLNSRSPKTDRWHGYTDLSMLDMSFLVEGPITPKLSVLGTARRSHFGELLQLAMKATDASGITVVPYYWDYVVRADFKPNDKNHLTL